MSEAENTEVVAGSGEPEQVVAETTETEVVDATETEESTTSEPGVDPAEKPKPKGAGKRIGELTHKRKLAEQERDYWKEQALNGKQPPAKTDVVTDATEAPKAPNSLNYDSDDDYQKAMDVWLDQATDRKLSQKEKQAEEKRVQVQQQEVFQTWESKQSDFADKYEDYYDVAHAEDLPISKDMVEALTSSDKGPEILYHLGRNPQEAARICQLPPIAAAREIGKIEAKIALTPPKKTTNAPPPINTLSGAGTGAVIDQDSMTTNDWMEARRKQLN